MVQNTCATGPAPGAYYRSAPSIPGRRRRLRGGAQRRPTFAEANRRWEGSLRSEVRRVLAAALGGRPADWPLRRRCGPFAAPSTVKAAAGFLAGSSGPTRRRTGSIYPSSTGVATSRPSAVRGEAHAHRALRRRARGAPSGAGDDRPPPVKSATVLPLRRRDRLIERSPAVHVRRPVD